MSRRVRKLSLRDANSQSRISTQAGGGTHTHTHSSTYCVLCVCACVHACAQNHPPPQPSHLWVCGCVRLQHAQQALLPLVAREQRVLRKRARHVARDDLLNRPTACACVCVTFWCLRAKRESCSRGHGGVWLPTQATIATQPQPHLPPAALHTLTQRPAAAPPRVLPPHPRAPPAWHETRPA